MWELDGQSLMLMAETAFRFTRWLGVSFQDAQARRLEVTAGIELGLLLHWVLLRC